MNDAARTALDALKERLTEIRDLEAAQRMLVWDQATYLPAAGGDGRGRQIAILGGLGHERQVDPELGRLLTSLREVVADLAEDDPHAALVNVAWRDFERAVRVPPAFMAELASHQAHGYEVWKRARKDNDFKAVRPILERTLALSRQLSAYHGPHAHPADPLIDESDPGFTAQRVTELFSALRDRLVPLVDTVSARPQADRGFLFREWAQASQLAFCAEVAQALGYDFQRGRLDTTHHPFMIRLGYGDIRITTRADADNMVHGLFAAIHETGHALYEQGIPQALDGTPLGQGTAASTHESQSRLWENRVGRSSAFWQWGFPRLTARTNGLLAGVALPDFVAAINTVRRSLIRVDADELTYNLHVMLRFELELELLDGRLSIADLPAQWNDRMEASLGVRPASDIQGVLQDVHWYSGRIGGEFQGYALGNIMSAQFYDAAVRANPGIPDDIAAGRFAPLLGWLRENIYRFGRIYAPLDLVERATGGPLSIEPYLSYLSGKYLDGRL